MIVATVFEYDTDPTLADIHRPAHRKYLADLLDRQQLVAAGAFTDGSGALIVYQAENFEAAEMLIRNDPFFVGGVFKAWKLHPWKPVFSAHELLPKQPS